MTLTASDLTALEEAARRLRAFVERRPHTELSDDIAALLAERNARQLSWAPDVAGIMGLLDLAADGGYTPERTKAICASARQTISKLSTALSLAEREKDMASRSGADPEWLVDLVSKVRMIAKDARGTTSLGGKLIGFDRLLAIAANQLERLPTRPPHEDQAASRSQVEAVTSVADGSLAAETLLRSWCDQTEPLLAGRHDHVRMTPDDALKLIRMVRYVVEMLPIARQAQAWRQEMYEQASVVDQREDAWREHVGICRAAWELCDDTEGTVFNDEFGEHYRVPKEAWDRLAAELAREPWRESQPVLPSNGQGEVVPSGPVNCTYVLRREGRAYPRTCERCRLGPCPFYHNDGSAKR